MKQLISVCIPCRNEVENVQPLAEDLVKHLEQFPQYDFEIIFIDNDSIDGTQNMLREICSKDKRVKAIFNVKNFPGSGMHVMLQTRGICTIILPADFQVPLELVPQMIIEWEKGAKVVALRKKTGKHDKYRLFRKAYYVISKRFSSQSASGSAAWGLYDKSFIDICKATNDPLVNIIYMASLYAAPLRKLEYIELPRRSGKSNNSFFSLLNISITRFIHASDLVPRCAIFAGLGMAIISLIISLYYLIRKLLNWHEFPLGIAPLVIGVFFLGSMQLVFLGLIGEYVLVINDRQKNKPFVVEKERINFDDVVEENE